MLLLLDNYDSFTFNLVQYFGELGADVTVFRNDMLTLSDIEEINPDEIVISPGPCTPNEAGISLDVVKHFCDKTPILGVCLGHQCITQHFGGEIVKAKAVMHGKSSDIHHNQRGLFSELPHPFVATRYHSLVAERSSLPSCLEVTAWTDDDEIMAIQHRSLPVVGVQFHPESILTSAGHLLLANFLHQYNPHP